jgi:hypothetical protein
MPSSWLVSPEITIGALTMAYTITYEFVKYYDIKKSLENYFFKDVNITKYDTLFFCFHPTKIKSNITISQTTHRLRKDFDEIAYVIRSLELYSEYEDFIEHILQMVENNETWDSNKNILESWRRLF